MHKEQLLAMRDIYNHTIVRVWNPSLKSPHILHRECSHTHTHTTHWAVDHVIVTAVPRLLLRSEVGTWSIADLRGRGTG